MWPKFGWLLLVTQRNVVELAASAVNTGLVIPAPTSNAPTANADRPRDGELANPEFFFFLLAIRIPPLSLAFFEITC